MTNSPDSPAERLLYLVTPPILFSAARHYTQRRSLSGSTDLFNRMTDAGRAWVWTHGTREGIACAYSHLLPHLRSLLPEYEAAGYPIQDERTVAEVIHAVAAYWSKAGWGPFAVPARGGGVRFVDGKGAWPRGPARPHLRKAHRLPRLDAVRHAVADFERAGVDRPTAPQIIDAVRKATGVTLTRGAVADPRREGNGVARALADLPIRLAALARGLRRQLPLARVHLLRIADIAAVIYPRSDNASTIRTHRSRAAAALLQIGQARVGLTVAIVGDLTVIGRQRSLPLDLKGYARTARIRDLRDLLLEYEIDLTKPRPEVAAAEEMLQVVDRLQEATADHFEEEITGGMKTVYDAIAAGVPVDAHIPALGAQRLCDKIDEYRAVGWDYHPTSEDIEAIERRLEHQAMSHAASPGSYVIVERERWPLSDKNLCELFGVESRWAFETYRGTFRGAGPDFDDRFSFHFRAIDDLRRQAGTCCNLGALYRWCHERGGIAMSAEAERIAAALDGVYETRKVGSLTPTRRRPGRTRAQAPTGPTPRARRIGRVTLAKARSATPTHAVYPKNKPAEIAQIDNNVEILRRNDQVLAEIPLLLLCA